jgi:U3 small nucleolar RNA-associated protein 3
MRDAYGESSSLQHADAADKKARKKSLRFHTSKIESASARRQGARNLAVGGDDDLPYRERRKQKEARLAKEAAAKVRGQGGADLDDTAPEPRDERREKEDDGSSDEVNGPDGYYELVKKKSKARKEQKKAEYEATQAAARYVLICRLAWYPSFVMSRFDNDKQDDMSGPRSLTRAILANKGLTPHRAKAVRNPRVKKRQKFEKAKKKLSSQKPVYKGGLSESGGRYDGEKSGISKVVKSVQIG